MNAPCAGCGTETPVDDLIEAKGQLWCAACAPRIRRGTLPATLGPAVALFAVPICAGYRVTQTTTDLSSETSRAARLLIFRHTETSSFSGTVTGVTDSEPVTTSIDYVGAVFGLPVVLLSLIAVVEGLVRRRVVGSLLAAAFTVVALAAWCCAL